MSEEQFYRQELNQEGIQKKLNNNNKQTSINDEKIK